MWRMYVLSSSFLPVSVTSAALTTTCAIGGRSS